MKTYLLPCCLAALLTAAAVHAGPVANGGFESAPQNPAAINPWQVFNGSRIALSGCTSAAGTSVTCASTVGLVAGMRLSGSGLVTNPPNATIIVAQPITSTSFAVSGGTITTCPSTLLGSNAVPPPALVVGRTTGPVHLGQFSLRVDGRDSALDGPRQNLTGLVNGGRYTTRFAILPDAPVQVRCLVLLPGSPQPVILAEKVVDAAELGQWVSVEGTTTLNWSGSQTSGTMFFTVEQIYNLGVAAPAGVFPGYNLDTVEMEIDTDGDGYWDSEEMPDDKNTSHLLADSDTDGLPDKWEITNLLNPNDNTDASLDADTDGHSNKIEYWANTDPQNANSFPGITTDPQASPATKALLYYLQTRGARGNGRYLTGHHAQDIASGDYANYVVGLNALMTTAGHPSWISILSIAAEGPSAAQPLQIAASGPVLRDYMDAGGLGIIHWTPRNPWTNNSNGDKTGVDIADLMTPGTTANTRMVGWMDAVAAEIALFGPDRPVIFRPFSEQNGGWNWYGRLPRDEFIELYRWLRLHFENAVGYQHNIIWTIEHHIGSHRAISTSNTGVSMDYYYPGDDLIDLVGFSAYISGWNPGFDANAQSRLHPKAFAITEGGPPPTEDDVPNAYNSTYLTALDTWYPRSAFFVIWNSWPTGPFVAIKDNANYVELLTDTRVTNREGMLWRAPSGLAASAASSTQFALGWSGTTGATAYALESSATGLAPWFPAGNSTPTVATLGGFSAATMRYFRVRAIYQGGDSAPLSIASATTWSLFQQWKNDALGNFAAPDLGDDDSDGLVTLLEYGIGTHPLTASPPPAQSLVNVAGANYLALTFRRHVGSSGVSTIVEATGDLLTGMWQPDPVLHGTPVDNGDGTEIVTFRDIIPLGSASTRFLRLRVTLP